MSRSSRLASRLLGGLAAAFLAGAAPEPASAQDMIPAGTQISVRVAESIDSRNADLQHEYAAELDEPVVVDGVTLVPDKSKAFLRVVQVEQAGAARGRAALSLRLEAIAVKGRRVPIGSESVTAASGSQGAKAAKGGILGGIVGAGVGAAVGGGGGAIRGAAIGASGGVGVAALSGQRVQVAKETRLTFTLSSERSLDPDAQPALTTTSGPDSAPGAALTVAMAQDIRFELASAVANGNVLTVTLYATNQGPDRTLTMHYPIRHVEVTMIDAAGGTFRPAEYTVGNQNNSSDIINGVRMPIVLRFDQMPTLAGRMQATQIRRLTAALEVRQGSQPHKGSTIEFQFIPIQGEAAESPATPSTAAVSSTVAASNATGAHADVRFEFVDATAEGKSLTLTLYATNDGVDRRFFMAPAGGYETSVQLIDDGGNNFMASSVVIGNRENDSELINDVRTKIAVRFNDMPTIGGSIQASEIKRLTLKMRIGNNAPVGQVELRNLPIKK